MGAQLGRRPAANAAAGCRACSRVVMAREPGAASFIVISNVHDLVTTGAACVQAATSLRM